MDVKTGYVEVPVKKYVAYDGTVFDDEAACLDYESKGADPNPSVRFFNCITELVPSDHFPIEKVLDLATAFVVIDPKRAQGFLHHLSNAYGLSFPQIVLDVGTICISEQNSKSFTVLENRILSLIRLYNGLMTVCEPYLGSGAMEIGVDWRARA